MRGLGVVAKLGPPLGVENELLNDVIEEILAFFEAGGELKVTPDVEFHAVKEGHAFPHFGGLTCT